MMEWEGDVLERPREILGNPQRNWKPYFKKGRNQIVEKYLLNLDSHFYLS